MTTDKNKPGSEGFGIDDPGIERLPRLPAVPPSVPGASTMAGAWANRGDDTPAGVGTSVGIGVGTSVGIGVGTGVGVGTSVGIGVGTSVGIGAGTRFGVGAGTSLEMGSQQTPIDAATIAQTKYERLSERHRMLLSLLDSDTLELKSEELFPEKLTVRPFILYFHSSEYATLDNYASLLITIDHIYRNLLTFIARKYFLERWLGSTAPTFEKDHLLVVTSIRQMSPGELHGTGVRVVTSALRDVLSIGRQIEDFRKADIRVQEAKLELEKKREELEAAKRQKVLRDEVQQRQMEVERAKLELELEKLRTQRIEEIRRRGKLFTDLFDDKFNELMKNIPALAKSPEDIIEEFKAELRAGLTEIQHNKLIIDGINIV